MSFSLDSDSISALHLSLTIMAYPLQLSLPVTLLDLFCVHFTSVTNVQLLPSLNVCQTTALLPMNTKGYFKFLA